MGARAKQDIAAGQVFGRLTTTSSQTGAIWLCRCSCGKSTHVYATQLRSGNCTSCGCLLREKRGAPPPSTEIEIDGITKTVVEWSNEIGTDRLLINQRLRAGWDPKKAVMTPARPKFPALR